ncbi:hypothetical protein [Algoriphagus hitonicola]|uniref:Uncharacterized protein n=1 Tax=Algoriphagus hitonicola TaxID=435880 RepID=A0A1I2X544_9BACT|nr:hypothetical protein [Algoriphagus hitonicola]SFH08645.1 hypothetical protein SAMN04487988_11652 [Algoriphagus hitonicola]
MKFLGFFFLTVLLVVLVNPWIPYWGVMILIFILGFVMKSGNLISFFAGGLGMGWAWMGQGLYISLSTGSDLSDKMAGIFGVGSGVMMLILTGVLGFLLGSFSGLAGNLLRKIFHREQRDIYRGPVSY